MPDSIQRSLEQLFSRFEICWKNSGYPSQEYDPQWPSPCQICDHNNPLIEWHPVPQHPTQDFYNIESALEIRLHPDIHPFYGLFFSDPLPALFKGHKIDLIQAWNSDDFKRLQQNMIQHVLMQRQLKQPTTLFIATTEDEMEIISLVNDTGAVVVERLGKGVVEQLTPSLAEFIAELTPNMEAHAG